jgi:cellulase/cellobiase CelA1
MVPNHTDEGLLATAETGSGQSLTEFLVTATACFRDSNAKSINSINVQVRNLLREKKKLQAVRDRLVAQHLEALKAVGGGS